MALQVTDGQRKRMLANRDRAMEIRRMKQAQNGDVPTVPGTIGNVVTPSTSGVPAPVAVQSAPVSVVRQPEPRPANMKKVKVRLELAERSMFLVDFKYDSDLIALCKSMTKRKYDPQSKCWLIHLHEYDQFLQKLKANFPEAEIDKLPEFVRKNFRASFENKPMPKRFVPLEDAQLVERLGADFVQKLFLYQKEGISFAVSKNGRALIADEMGLGKTLQALGVAAWFPSAWPLLIVTPSSMRFAWKQAIERWLQQDFHYNDIYVITKGSDQYPIEEKRIAVIVSYDLMVSMKKKLLERKFGMVILDESHLIKDPKAQRTQAATMIVEKAGHRLLLTGTPALSRPAELFKQIVVLNRAVVGSSFREFGFRYCEGRDGRFCFEANGSTNSTELKLLLEETIMIRRLKADVMTQLPEKTRRMVVLDKEHVRNNIAALRDAAKSVERAHEAGASGADVHQLVLQWYNETGIAKADAVKKYLIDILSDENTKCLVFAHHTFVMDALAQGLSKERIEHVRIDGRTSATRRRDRCDSFQSDPSIRCALLGITAASTGLTLTAANTVVFAELHWNPGTLLQAEDRAHRVGQKNCVDAHYLIAAGTADDHIWKLVNKKLGLLGSAGLANDTLKSADDNKTRIVDTPGEQRKMVGLFYDAINTLPLEDYFVSVPKEALLQEAGESESVENDHSEPIAKKAKSVDHVE